MAALVAMLALSVFRARAIGWRLWSAHSMLFGHLGDRLDRKRALPNDQAAPRR